MDRNELKVAIDLIKINIEANSQSIKNNFEYTPKEYLLLQNETYTTIIECLERELDRQENGALTLEELKEMVGEPVWIKDGNKIDCNVILGVKDDLVITDFFSRCGGWKYQPSIFYKQKPTE